MYVVGILSRKYNYYVDDRKRITFSLAIRNLSSPASDSSISPQTPPWPSPGIPSLKEGEVKYQYPYRSSKREASIGVIKVEHFKQDETNV